MAMIRVMSREFEQVRFDLFLDRAKVTAAVDRKSRRVLSRTGGFVRTKVRQSMKKKPKRLTKSGRISKAYQRSLTESGPPRWTTRGLKDNIFFFYDDRRKSVTIGPRPFKQTKTAVPSRRKSGASLLEFGGAARVRILNRPGKPWVRAKFRKRSFMAPQQPAAHAKLKENLATIRFGS